MKPNFLIIGAVEVEPPDLDEKSLRTLKDYFRDDIKQLKQLTPPGFGGMA